LIQQFQLHLEFLALQFLPESLGFLESPFDLLILVDQSILAALLNLSVLVGRAAPVDLVVHHHHLPMSS
jgi:hypothetical protein